MTTTQTRRLLLVAVTALVTFALATLATAQTRQPTGVVFSFTPQTVGEVQQYVLIPIPNDQVRPDLNQRISVSNAFNLLRDGKAATYGGTALRLTDDDLANSQAVVTIDPSRAEYFLIIAAETVYSFTQLGIERVIFPGFAENGLTRADIPYGAYSVTLPMWQVLPPVEVFETQVALPDGSTMASADFYPWIEGASQEAQDAVYLYLQSEHAFEVLGVMAALPGLGFEGFEDQLIGLMQHPVAAVREAALNALVGSDRDDVWEMVVQMMQNDTDARLRSMAATALGQSNNDTFRAYIVFADAAEGPIDQRVAAIGELATMEDERINEQLANYLQDPEPPIVDAAIRGLVSRTAFDELEAAMLTEGLHDAVRDLTAQALIDFGGPEQQLDALNFLAGRSTGLQAASLIDRINATDGIDQRLAVEAFLTHEDEFVQLHVASLLAARGDTASIEALSALVDSATPSLRVGLDEAANQIMAPLGVEQLQDFAESDNAFVQRSAYRALGNAAANGNATDELFQMLAEGLAAEDDGIRGASARAIGAWATQEALDLILPLAEDPSILVQADVARALGYFGDEAFLDAINPLIAANIQSGEPEIIAGGLDAVAMLGRDQLLPVVLEYAGHDSPHVRASAMRCAADLVEVDRPRPVINALTGGLRDDVRTNRIIAARLLGRFDHELAVLGISQVVNEQDQELRFAAIEALASTGNRQAASILAGLLEDPSREIKMAAIEAIAALGYNYVVPNIERSMSFEEDPEVLAAEQALIATLNASGQ